MPYDFDHQDTIWLGRLEKLEALEKLRESLESFFHETMPEIRTHMMRICYFASEEGKRLDDFNSDSNTYFYRCLQALIGVMSFSHNNGVLDLLTEDKKYFVSETDLLLVSTDGLMNHYGFLDDWTYYPAYLQIEHVEDPLSFIEEFFKYKNIDLWRRTLDELHDCAIAPRSYIEGNDIIDNPIKIFLYLMRLIDASSLIRHHLERRKYEKTKDNKEAPDGADD